MSDPPVTTERRRNPRSPIPSRFLTFTRAEWAPLRANTPLTLSDEDLTALRGLNDVLSMEDVVEIYLPLSRLLSLYVQGTRTLHSATSTFLGDRSAKTPFILGLAGSVAVGKSTTARILQALLSRWPDHPRVDLLTTDGFLLPNRVLEERGLMQRKGFPESYDRGRLVRFLADVKSGAEEVTAPVYSHVRYDIVPG
ncbi:MAG TPA: type I pantothenate kinase, partial [Vicinamibacterales bacterium]|nr:type I pantothenate kinase [Vicinamibacterales bacterium]